MAGGAQKLTSELLYRGTRVKPRKKARRFLDGPFFCLVIERSIRSEY